MKTIERQSYLDWLRILSIAGVLLLHSAMPYVAEETWHVKDQNTSTLLLYFTAFLHLFRMPLLFFISGTVSFYMMQRRSATHFIGLRVTRLLIPLLVGMFIIVPPQIYMERLAQGYQGNYWTFYKTVFEFKPYPMGGSFSWHHLWFIAYLFIYDIIFAPFFMWMISAKSNGLKKMLEWMQQGKRTALMALPSIIWFVWLSGKYPQTGDLVHDGCYFVYWLLFVLAGFICILVPGLMDSLQRNRRFFMAVGFVSLLLFYYRWFNMPAAPAVHHSALQNSIRLLFVSLRPVIAWSFVFGLVGYGKAYLNRTHRILPYLNQAVYPFYILHQTVIVILAFYFKRSAADTVLIKYIYTTVITLLVSMGIFHFFIQPYRIIRFLFGMKPVNEPGNKKPVTATAVFTKERMSLSTQ